MKYKRYQMALLAVVVFSLPFLVGSSVHFDMASTSKIDELQLVEETKKIVSELCQKDKFSGTVLIAKDGKVLFEKACGEASKRFHVNNTIDTKFNLGSMNKMFTAVAIMQLVEKGELQLDDPLNKYLDETWLPEEITRKITIHHLLSHSSGLGSYFNETFWKTARGEFRTVNDFKPLVNTETLAFEPGEKFAYSNTGILLLGAVIEQVTGQDYFDFVNDAIYSVAEMSNTDSYEMDQPVENLAIGYVPTSKNKYGWENNIYKHVLKGGPAGGGFSTVRDLHKFAVALNGEKLVSKASLELLFTDYMKEGYGYGFGIRKTKAGKMVGHSGGFPGLNSSLQIFLDAGYVVVVMSNYDRAASPVAEKIRNLVEKVK